MLHMAVIIASSHLLITAVVSPFIYVVGLVIYRLLFHPLSKCPGPKLAAATELYECYFDIARLGMFIWEIEKMHERYGMESILSFGRIDRIPRMSLSGFGCMISPIRAIV